MRPEVEDLECHGDCVLKISLLLLPFSLHSSPGGVWPRTIEVVCKGWEHPLPLYVHYFIIKSVHVGVQKHLACFIVFIVFWPFEDIWKIIKGRKKSTKT